MQAVIFDIDGTLLESMRVDGEIYTASIKSVLGDVLFRNGWEDYEHVTDGGILNGVLADNSIPHKSEYVDAIKHECLARMRAHILEHGPFVEMPGAKQLIQRLIHSSNHRVGIATGGWRAIARLKLDSAGFNISGIPLSTSDEAVARPDIMEAALIEMGKDFDRITYYGDAEWDRKACQSLGWEFQPVGSHLNGLRSFSDATGV